MEHVEGRTLQERIQEAPTDASSRSSWSRLTQDVWLIEKVARILHQAHEAGVVHRDVKPGNIMLRADGEPVVLDFGLAWRDDDNLPTLTGTGEHLGTPAYMSPEQIAGSGPRPDRRTDVWALGITLFECLTGRRPFEAPTRDALYRAILGERMPSARRLNPSVPRDLEIVLEVATEKDRARRYATAEEFADDLARVRRREPVRARPPGPFLRLKRWTQRHPAMAVLAATVTFGLAVSLNLLAKTRTALDDYERLADGRRLEELVREAAQDLWPAEPDRIIAMDAWLSRARQLAARLDEHRAALAALRERGRPVPAPPPEEEARERRALEEEETLFRQWLADSKDASQPGEWELWESRVRGRLAEIAQRKEEVTRRDHRAWHFDDDRDLWRHDQEKSFVIALEAFLASEPFGDTMSSVEVRRAFAANLWQRSVDDHVEPWTQTRAGVATDARFHGLRLEPQLGLVPLGMDPESGLQEFAHLPSGTPPERDRSTGRLQLTEESAIVLVLLPGGTFLMGAQRTDRDEPGFDRQAEDNAAPVHDVTLDPFFIAKHEVTQGQWRRVTGGNPSRHSELYLPKRFAPHTLLHPVESVTWHEVRRVLFRIGLVMPTEAQWEYACRAGTTTPWWTGEDRESLRGAANLADGAAIRYGATWEAIQDWPDLDDGYGLHAPVGSFRANPFGLHDVHGNVWEWCADPGVSYDTPPRAGDGFRGESAAAAMMVNRGGAYHEKARYARSAFRGRLLADVRSRGLGVRPARAVRHGATP
jgi:formylglycine-generating enzyme required for sulfatase activity